MKIHKWYDANVKKPGHYTLGHFGRNISFEAKIFLPDLSISKKAKLHKRLVDAMDLILREYE